MIKRRAQPNCWPLWVRVCRTRVLSCWGVHEQASVEQRSSSMLPCFPRLICDKYVSDEHIISGDLIDGLTSESQRHCRYVWVTCLHGLMACRTALCAKKLIAGGLSPLVMLLRALASPSRDQSRSGYESQNSGWGCAGVAGMCGWLVCLPGWVSSHTTRLVRAH